MRGLLVLTQPLVLLVILGTVERFISIIGALSVTVLSIGRLKFLQTDGKISVCVLVSNRVIRLLGKQLSKYIRLVVNVRCSLLSKRLCR